MPRHKEWRYDHWARVTTQAVLADKPEVLAFDTETTGLGFYDLPFAATLSWRTPGGALRNGYYDLEGEGREGRIDQLSAALLSAPAWVGHNTKFDLQKGMLCGAFGWDAINSRIMHDSQTLFYLLDENSKRGLKDLAVTHLGLVDNVNVVTKSGKNKGEIKVRPREDYRMALYRRKLGLSKDDGYHLLPRWVLIPYALADTDYTLQLFEKFLPRVEALGLNAVYRDEMDTAEVFLRIESEGFKLDLEYLERTKSEYGSKVMLGLTECAKMAGNPKFNPNSPDQILAFFRAQGMTLNNTQADTLELIDHPLAAAITQFKQDSKIHKTYLCALSSEQRDGRAHPWFNPLGARTGRTSSGAAKE